MFAGLTDAQADGLACVVCGLDYLHHGSSVSVPVGRSVTGSQVFACVGPCGEAIAADPEIGCRGRGGAR